MAKFSFNDYQDAVKAAQNKGQSQKIGFFKLQEDGAEALIRINLASLDDLQFATVHTLRTNSGKWMRVSCLNHLGSFEDNCELCSAFNNGNKNISRASKKVYVQLLASYKDKVTGTWTTPVPVIWERPAGFSKELANKLRDYGNLKEVLLKVTRNGAAGDMKTTYSLDYAVPTIFKADMIPADFSAFDNFNIAKHSYWEKTAEEIHEFMETGDFPEVVKAAPIKHETEVAAEETYGTVAQEAPAKAQEAPAAEPVQSTKKIGGFQF